MGFSDYRVNGRSNGLDMRQKMEHVRMLVQAMMQENVILQDMECSDYFGYRVVFRFERSDCQIAHNVHDLAHGDGMPLERIAQEIVSSARSFMDKRVQRDLGRALKQVERATAGDSMRDAMIATMTATDMTITQAPGHMEDAMSYAAKGFRGGKIPLPKVKTYRDEVQAKLDAWLN